MPAWAWWLIGGGVVVTTAIAAVVVAKRKGNDSRPVAGPGSREDLRSKVGTVAYNRVFTRRDLVEYGGSEGDFAWLQRQGYIEKVDGGWFPTASGWAWIEDQSLSGARTKKTRGIHFFPDDRPRYEVIESKTWVRDDGATASPYGAAPWMSDAEEKRWRR